MSSSENSMATVGSSEFEGFEPQDIHDKRFHLGDGFLAVDRIDPFERDDAFRVTLSRNGGFIVDVVMADTTLISHDDKVLATAFRRKSSSYNYDYPEQTSLLYPDPVIRALELSGNGLHRVLAVSAHYDADAQLVKEPDFFPALAAVTPVSFTDFISTLSRPGEDITQAPAIAFDLAQQRRLKDQYEIQSTKRDAVTHYKFPNALVGRIMMQTNRYAGILGKQKSDLPLLYYPGHHRHTLVPSGNPTIDRQIGPGPYARVTSGLRRAEDTINAHAIGFDYAGRVLPDPILQYLEAFAQQESANNREDY